MTVILTVILIFVAVAVCLCISLAERLNLLSGRTVMKREGMVSDLLWLPP